ncbi:MAG: aminoglycoside phosphotransferase family protein [Akkermansiaceae bacterium]|jgi:Ser/Thr protein kinase RdoA (MazF antagonist)|nr:aminoglycoside phosphotransferase family protein [Akkermansiaceae bacterium]MDP4646014.1 aminoglycoside phosphotransferase family protein [Akkermansiaceae bacterium]MDP4721250.1 aminoglycoside phosphotransferase family protein [Akkermansiaceae bacterium]MDP4778726.1 aminoglycoside phosphotransferase family protein [Akkermansiaceae bacterium]MDP4846262.1 aminoglycoside phosphotransferase family protein [Akkermansiaceae bacterium]
MTLPEIAAHFTLPGSVESHSEIPTGLINSTHLVGCAGGQRFILQALNSAVFKKPAEVMENIRTVTAHIAAKDSDARGLELIPTTSGEPWLTLEDGTLWRCYPFIEGTESFTKITSPDLAYKAAAAFGDFQAKLADLAPSLLHETLPDFHNTPSHFSKLLSAAEKDPRARLSGAHEEFDYILSQKALTTLLTDADLPVRITHNDTKISNILFHTDGSAPPVVIDLDTVMPGSALYDFGDLVRSAAASADESEADPEKVFLDPALTKALTEGYLSTAADFLTPAETALLQDSVKVITLELACRFLADHLLGDIYFKTNTEGHNLIRARNQLALLKSM